MAPQRPGRRRRQRPTAAEVRWRHNVRGADDVSARQRPERWRQRKRDRVMRPTIRSRTGCHCRRQLDCSAAIQWDWRQLRSEVQGARVPQSPRDNGDGVDAGEASGRWVTVFSAWEAECWAVVSVESFVVESTVKPFVTGCSQDKRGTGLEKG